MQTENRPIIVWLERVILASLFLIAAFAPISIAVTQTAWLIGMTFWVLRLAIFPRPILHRTPIDYALFAFFILSGVSAVFSYEPVQSIGKMRAAALFTIVYIVAQNVSSFRIVRFLVLTLVAAGVLSVMVTIGQTAVGKGVKVYGVKPDSPLSLAVFHTRTVTKATPIIDGDTVWEIDGVRIDNPEELAAALAATGKQEPAKVRIHRVEWIPSLEVPRGKLLVGTDPLQQLGIVGWSRGRDWRATGLFGHWVTYAEVLQLLASLTLGLLLALPNKKSRKGIFLLLSLLLILVALGLTVTRASWIGFAFAAALLLAMSVSRRMLIAMGVMAIPLLLAGVFVLQQKRSIGFFDSRDQSTSWRQTVWREGFMLLTSNPRHLIFGVGMDSIKGHWREWGLFDNGRLPIGHMHSNPLQIAVERGVPALIGWLVLIALYGRTLLRILRGANADERHWMERGIALGALGGLLGFFVSGIVHYNWGDSEVVTILYFIMGLSLVIERLGKNNATPTQDPYLSSPR